MPSLGNREIAILYYIKMDPGDSDAGLMAHCQPHARMIYYLFFVCVGMERGGGGGGAGNGYKALFINSAVRSFDRKGGWAIDISA